MGAAASATARQGEALVNETRAAPSREVRVPSGALSVRFRRTPGIGPRVAEVPAEFALLRVGEHVVALDGADVSALSGAEFCDRMKACSARPRVLRVLPPVPGWQLGVRAADGGELASPRSEAKDGGGGDGEHKAGGGASESDPSEDSLSSVTQFIDQQHDSSPKTAGQAKPVALNDGDVALMLQVGRCC